MMNNSIYEYKYNPWSPIPPPKLNGGLYTGKPFKEGAGWANIIVHPTSAYMTHINLRSAGGPPASWYQMQGGDDRFGNNSDPTIADIINFTGNDDMGPYKDIKCINKTFKEDCFINHISNDCETKVIQIA